MFSTIKQNFDTSKISKGCTLAYDENTKSFYGMGRNSGNIFKGKIFEGLTVLVNKQSDDYIIYHFEKNINIIVEELNLKKNIIRDKNDGIDITKKQFEILDIITFINDSRREINNCNISWNLSIVFDKETQKLANLLYSYENNLRILQLINKIDEEISIKSTNSKVNALSFLKMKDKNEIMSNLGKIYSLYLILHESWSERYYFIEFVTYNIDNYFDNEFKLYLDGEYDLNEFEKSMIVAKNRLGKTKLEKYESFLKRTLESITKFIEVSNESDFILTKSRKKVELQRNKIKMIGRMINDVTKNVRDITSIFTHISEPTKENNVDEDLVRKVLNDIKNTEKYKDIKTKIYNSLDKKCKNILSGIIDQNGFRRNVIFKDMKVDEEFIKKIKKEKNVFDNFELAEYDLDFPDEDVNILRNMIYTKYDERIKYNSAKYNIFSFYKLDKYIFKSVKCKYTSEYIKNIVNRYKKVLYAKKVCNDNNLNLLVVPKSKLIFCKDTLIIIEEKLNFNSLSSVQEHIYRTKYVEMKDVIMQLALFISLTGLNDVVWRNIPVLENTLKIGLIDTDEMDNVSGGLFRGSYDRTGLLECTNPIYKDEILKIAVDNTNMSLEFFEYKAQRAYDRRVKYLENDDRIEEYHKTKNIKTGFEPIILDESKIDFSKYNNDEKIIKTIVNLVTELNILLGMAVITDTKKGKRTLYLDLNGNNGMHKSLQSTHITFFDKDACEFEDTYLGICLTELERLNVIFKLEKIYGWNYTIQA
uniref:Uncharacterized protein n=1 Tax=Pithovirus LCPAC101 TaxID=2506586 RepID=A0A481Z419_9VIRU|nr:MAG: hypothetical protein LCPAC101_00710 [Pithovirus LCPAC101]